MPYANNRDIRIYYEVEGKGPWVVLAHGLFGDHTFWSEYGYVEALVRDHRLILLDVRGHGRSSKPKNPTDYRSDRRVADIVAVLDDLAVSQTHFLGYSMGARLGFEMANHAPERLHSMILGGMHPYPEDLESVRQQHARYEQGLEAVVSAAEKAHGPLSPRFRAAGLNNDAEAILAWIDRPRDDLIPGVRRFARPSLLFVGDADPRHDGAERIVGEMPNATFVSLHGLDHWTGATSVDQILPHIRAFLRSQGCRRSDP